MKEPRLTFTYTKHIIHPTSPIYTINHNQFKMYTLVPKRRVYRTFNPTWKLLPRSKFIVLEHPREIVRHDIRLIDRY